MFLASFATILIIFLINIVPAFMPPTWTLLSMVGFHFNFSILALIIFSVFAAIASTSGRVILAMLSKRIIRDKVLSSTTLQNIDALKQNIEKRKVFTFSFFLFFAFSPLPSGQVFMAYGLTDLRLRTAVIPFFIGRLCSYIFWALTASGVAEIVSFEDYKTKAFFGTYFVLAQLVAFYLIYLFVKIDWKVLFEEKKIRFIKKII